MRTVAEPKPESLRRGTAWSLTAQLATALGTAVLTLYLVRALGPAGFGIFALAISIGGLILEPSDFGISVATARAVAIHREDPRQVRIDLRAGVRLRLVASGLVAAALVALAAPIAGAYGEPALAWPLRWIALTVFAQGLLGFYRGVAGSLRSQSLGFRMVASESAAETVASIALVALGFGAAGAAAGRATGYLVGALVAIWLTVRRVGPHLLRRGDGDGDGGAARRGIAAYARSLFALDLAFAVSAQLATLLIGAFLNVAAVAFFAAPIRLITFLGYPGLSLANALAPRLAGDGGRLPDPRVLELSLRRLIVFQGLLLPPLIAWSEPIVRLLLGRHFAESASVLRALVPYVFFAGLIPVVTLSMSYLGHAALRLRISLVSIVLGVVLLLVLLPTAGLTGAAIATGIDAAYLALAHLWFLHSRAGLALAPLAVTTARVLPAVAASSLVLVALGTSAVPAPGTWVAAALACPIVYLTALIATRELSVAELRAAAGRLLRRGR